MAHFFQAGRLSAEDAAVDTDGSSTQQQDAFMNAIEIAAAARKVRAMAVHANEKLSCITTLQERALLVADELSRMADSVSATATSVAVIALQACQLSSYQEAYASNVAYAEKLGLDEFLEVIDRRPNEPSYRGLKLRQGRKEDAWYGEYKSAFKPQKVTSNRNSTNDDIKIMERFLGRGQHTFTDKCMSDAATQVDDVRFCSPLVYAPQKLAGNSMNRPAEHQTEHPLAIKLQEQTSDVDEDSSGALASPKPVCIADITMEQRLPLGPLYIPGNHHGVRMAAERPGLLCLNMAATEPLVSPRKLGQSASKDSSPRSYKSDSDSEVEDAMSSPRQLTLVKTIDHSEVDGMRLTPKPPAIPRALSPLLNKGEQGKVMSGEKLPHNRFLFQHSTASDNED